MSGCNLTSTGKSMDEIDNKIAQGKISRLDHISKATTRDIGCRKNNYWYNKNEAPLVVWISGEGEWRQID